MNEKPFINNFLRLAYITKQIQFWSKYSERDIVGLMFVRIHVGDLATDHSV
jgi:hypothetical protein